MKKSGVKKFGSLKKWFFGLLVFCIFTSPGSTAIASTIEIIAKGYGGNYGEHSEYPYAGEWVVTVYGIPGVNDGTFRTFCLERNEFIKVGAEYNAFANTVADNGGLGNGGLGIGRPDPLDPRTAWLYTQYLGGFSGYPGYAVDEDAEGILLQEAIWALEDELFGDELEELENNPDNNWYYKLAITYGTAWTDIGNVRVLNLTDEEGKHQDLLALAVNPVPVPGAFWLLGSGLLGLAGIRMRSKKNRSINTEKEK